MESKLLHPQFDRMEKINIQISNFLFRFRIFINMAIIFNRRNETLILPYTFGTWFPTGLKDFSILPPAPPQFVQSTVADKTNKRYLFSFFQPLRNKFQYRTMNIATCSSYIGQMVTSLLVLTPNVTY